MPAFESRVRSADGGQVVLFYTLPNRRPSPGVSLREIAETAHQ